MLEGESVVVAARFHARRAGSQVAASVMEPVMIGSAKSFSDARVWPKCSGRVWVSWSLRTRTGQPYRTGRARRCYRSR